MNEIQYLIPLFTLYKLYNINFVPNLYFLLLKDKTDSVLSQFSAATCIFFMLILNTFQYEAVHTGYYK